MPLSELEKRLPSFAREALDEAGEQAEKPEEIRFRIGCLIEIVSADGSVFVPPRVSRSMMDDLICILTGASVYTYDRQMAQGYIPLPGGHRAGICGRLARDDQGAVHMHGVTSVCIRIARQIPGASSVIRGHLLDRGKPLRVLFLGPPGCGKTTILRDAAVWLGGQMGIHVAAADERDELFPGEENVCASSGIDVMHGEEKAAVMLMMIRSMAPGVIVCDEIGSREDAEAICEAARCGIGLLASAHGDGIRAVRGRPVLSGLFDAGAFDRYICLERKGGCASVYDSRLEHIESYEWRCTDGGN